MKIGIELGGKPRKELVATVGKILDVKPEYLGAPTFKYQIGDFEIDREGNLLYSTATEGKTADVLLEQLKSEGFASEESDNPTVANVGNMNAPLVIEIPKQGFTETALENLEKVIESKGYLIKKSLGVEDLKIKYTSETIQFPWFETDSDADRVRAYTQFIAAICEMAKIQKRVAATKKQAKNEKYAFRCFLLRLGFIGDEFKQARKILLANLSGNSAFKKEKTSLEEMVE